MFPILRYSKGIVYPEYEFNFTFFDNTPQNQNFQIGEWVDSQYWCPKEIMPHRSIEHDYICDVPLECGVRPRKGYPFHKCHELPSNASENDKKKLDAMYWVYGIDDFIALITGIKTEDVVVGELYGYPYRQYKITAEGYAQWSPCSLTMAKIDSPIAPPQVMSYSVDATKLDNGDILFSASIHSINPDETLTHGEEEPMYTNKIPLSDFSFGTRFTLPCIPVPLTCTSYKLWKEAVQFKKPMWNIVYQCSGIYTPSSSDTLPENVVNETSYGTNGSVIRSVSGNIVNTRQHIISRKKITAYSMDQAPVYALGSECSGGIVISDTSTKETKIYWKSTGSDTFEQVNLTFYRHDIEVLS